MNGALRQRLLFKTRARLLVEKVKAKRHRREKTARRVPGDHPSCNLFGQT